MKNKVFLFALLACSIIACQESSTTTEVETPKTETSEAQSSDYYTEQHRPQFHFSPDSMWMNDPNGMVYYEGEYHLFYQYYPDSTVWGPMHWGHAVSEDLVHWEHLPIALYPDDLGLIFSGSAVVDWKNTSGFGTADNPPLIAIFTHHSMEGERAGRNDFQYQSIAYSTDKGRTWTKYEGNPVVPNTNKVRDFRDPKVFWDEASERWVMIFAAGDRVMLYNSPDLKSWTFQSDFGLGWGNQARPWECPDLFEMPIEGTNESKWVMIVSVQKTAPNGGSAAQYFVGDFDGKNFTIDADFAKGIGKNSNTGRWIDWGKDNYAGVTWSDVPESDGRRLFMGWMSNWQYALVVPTERWRSAMTIARSLSLRETEGGLRVFSQPVKEMKQLRGASKQLSSEATDFRLAEVLIEAKGDVMVEVSNSKGEKVTIGYEAAANQYYIDRSQSGKVDFSDVFSGKFTAQRVTKGDATKMQIFLDVSSVELFGDDGESVLTNIFFPNEEFDTIRVLGEGVESAILYELERTW